MKSNYTMNTIFAHRACGILFRFIRQYKGCYLLPANICPVVPLTFRQADMDFEFVDIDPDTLCIDENKCLDLIDSGLYDGIVFVHTYGTNYNPQSFFKKLKFNKQNRNEFHIIDDKCLCRPDIKSLDTYADLTIYSTGYAKYVDLGGGGYGFLKEGLSISEEIVPYEGFDIEPFYKNAFKQEVFIQQPPQGWLDAYVSDKPDALFLKQLQDEIDKIERRKRVINSVYSNAFDATSCLKDEFNQWRFNILVDDKDRTLKRIFDAGLFASSHYRPANKLFDNRSFPNADYIYSHIINLFNDKYFSVEQAKKLVEIICC